MSRGLLAGVPTGTWAVVGTIGPCARVGSWGRLMAWMSNASPRDEDLRRRRRARRAAGAVMVLALRLANNGLEPEGRNWWILVEVVMGCAFVPAGALLLPRPERRWLGVAYVVVGTSQLLAALGGGVGGVDGRRRCDRRSDGRRRRSRRARRARRRRAVAVAAASRGRPGRSAATLAGPGCHRRRGGVDHGRRPGR